MPCSDGYPRDTVYVDRVPKDVQERLDITTRIACEHFTELEAAGKPIPMWALAWWTDHKKKDELRARIKRAKDGKFTS